VVCVSYSFIVLSLVAGGNPSANIAPSPNFLNDCSFSAYDNSVGCTNAALAAINHASTSERLPNMVLPTNWYKLSNIEQVFVTVNLERSARKLPVFEGLAILLDTSAQQAAMADADPDSVPSGFQADSLGGNWAGGDGNPLEADYLWMYDDGLNPDGSSLNLACSSADPSGCWGHRDNILGGWNCTPCLMGAGYAVPGGSPSWTELFVGGASGSSRLDVNWNQELPYFGVPDAGVDAGTAADAGEVVDAGLADAGKDDGGSGGCGTRGGLNGVGLLALLALFAFAPATARRSRRRPGLD
jgi:hypothetical protein